MGIIKQTARKCTGGRAPRKQTRIEIDRDNATESNDSKQSVPKSKDVDPKTSLPTTTTTTTTTATATTPTESK